MPGPPPPPPPPMGAPPPPSMPVFSSSKSGAGDGRNQLLQSIRQGSKLKKTVTVDKSAPLISGKSANVESSAGSGAGGAIGNGIGARGPPVNGGGPMGLGGLFAGGMPKLKPTGRGIVAAQTLSNSVAKPSLNTQLSQERSSTKSHGWSPQPDKKSDIAPKPTAHNGKNMTLPNPNKRNSAHKSQQRYQQPNASTVPQPLALNQGSQHVRNIVQSRFTANVHADVSPVVVEKHKFSTLNNTKKSQISQLLNQTLGGGVAGGSKPDQQGPRRPQGANASNRAPPPQPPPPQPSSLKTNPPQPPQESATSPTITQRITSLHNQPEEVVVRNAVPNASSLHRNSFKFGAPAPLKIPEPTGWTTSLNQDSNYGGSMPSLVQSIPTPIAVAESDTHLSDSGPKIISHGKPNVAPKPPGIQPISGGSTAQSPKILNANGRPVSRAQSFKVTRSPPATPNPADPMSMGMMINNGFSTLRPNKISQSQEAVNKRPLPIIPKTNAPQPPPGLRMPGRPLRPPMHCPPPPPSRPTNLPPPPPPPHRHPVPPAPLSNTDLGHGGNPPQPPVRGSSMRNVEKDLDNRFGDRFRTINHFSFPDAFLRIEKTYSSTLIEHSHSTNANANKQQAPPPPPMMHIQLGNKMWPDNTSAC